MEESAMCSPPARPAGPGRQRSCALILETSPRKAMNQLTPRINSFTKAVLPRRRAPAERAAALPSSVPNGTPASSIARATPSWPKRSGSAWRAMPSMSSTCRAPSRSRCMRASCRQRPLRCRGGVRAGGRRRHLPPRVRRRRGDLGPDARAARHRGAGALRRADAEELPRSRRAPPLFHRALRRQGQGSGQRLRADHRQPRPPAAA